MFGNLGELAKMAAKAKEIQAGMKTFKEELPTMEFSATGPGGRVKAVVSGDFRIKAITVAPEALTDRVQLEEQITVAVNSAIAAAKAAAQERMAEITGGVGLDLPGLF